jgi:hypothetical protein
MKFLVQIIFIILLAWLLETFFPWWSISIAAFAGGFLLNTRYNFVAGFLGIALLWFAKALIISSYAATDLAQRVAEMLFVEREILLILATAFIGGIVGGFGALSGSLLKTQKRRYRY